MPDYKSIYTNQADAYDLMVQAEDCDGAVNKAINELLRLDGKLAIDVGVGTGRLSELLLKNGSQVIGVDIAPAMLTVARQRLSAFDSSLWKLAEGDARTLPCEDASADLAIAGWVLGHMTNWEANNWRVAIDSAINEMHRVVKPGGFIVILETLGTGTSSPRAPKAAHTEYYQYLSNDWSFTMDILRTDYLFNSVNEAMGATQFFFGQELSDKIRTHAWSRIPEFTGMWVTKICTPE